MSEKPTFLTEEGRKKLQEELDYLRTVRRPEIAKTIQQAKEGGDIMENAGYDEAKNAQAFLEGRILTLETMLKNAVIIEGEASAQGVQLGAFVTVVEDGETPERFQLVGSAEANPTQGRISNESPLGRALLGRVIGDKVSVQTPGGTRHFTIKDISWNSA